MTQLSFANAPVPPIAQPIPLELQLSQLMINFDPVANDDDIIEQALEIINTPGFNPNARPNGDRTLFEISVIFCRGLSQILVDIGADVNTARGPRAANALMQALSQGGEPAAFAFLLENRDALGINLDQANEHGVTAMHIAIEQGELAKVEQLIAAGADLTIIAVNEIFPQGLSYLQVAELAANNQVQDADQENFGAIIAALQEAQEAQEALAN